VAWVQLFQGIGVALFFMPVLQILLSDLEPHEIAAGSGLATFVRTLGGSFAASLTTYLWTERGAVHHAHLTEKVSAYDPGTLQAVAQYGGGDLQRGAAVVERMISNQAAQLGFNEIFHLLGILFLCVIAFVWIAKPPFAAKLGAPAGGGH
jgi:DHA2 family multidrug resistance protein